MAFPRPYKPAIVWRDLKAFLGEQGRYKYLFAFLSILMPTLLIAGFYVDSRVDPPGPQIIYIQNWPADRSDAEIKAQQKIDQAKRDAALEKRRRQFQKADEDLKRLGL
jgi:hypothetical protein